MILHRRSVFNVFKTLSMACIQEGRIMQWPEGDHPIRILWSSTNGNAIDINVWRYVENPTGKQLSHVQKCVDGPTRHIDANLILPTVTDGVSGLKIPAQPSAWLEATSNSLS